MSRVIKFAQWESEPHLVKVIKLGPTPEEIQAEKAEAEAEAKAEADGEGLEQLKRRAVEQQMAAQKRIADMEAVMKARLADVDNRQAEMDRLLSDTKIKCAMQEAEAQEKKKQLLEEARDQIESESAEALAAAKEQGTAKAMKPVIRKESRPLRRSSVRPFWMPWPRRRKLWPMPKRIS